MKNSILRSAVYGGLGLGLVSLAAYSIWAFAPKAAGSEGGMYALIALVYLAGTGLALRGLLQGENRMRRFYALFLPAFVLYAALWSAAWFMLGGRAGEWLGAAAGTVTMAWMMWRGLGRPAGFWAGAVALFVLHTAGYFAGSAWMYGLLDRGISGWEKREVATLAKLGWGLLHGLGFGAGLGFALEWWQRAKN